MTDQEEILQRNELLTEIVELRDRLGWTVKRLAEVVFVARDDDETRPDWVDKFYETFKKQLDPKRKTRLPLLREYRDIILRDDAFRNLDLVRPNYVENGALSETARRAISGFSRARLKQIEDEIEQELSIE